MLLSSDGLRGVHASYYSCRDNQLVLSSREIYCTTCQTIRYPHAQYALGLSQRQYIPPLNLDPATSFKPSDSTRLTGFEPAAAPFLNATTKAVQVGVVLCVCGPSMMDQTPLCLCLSEDIKTESSSLQIVFFRPWEARTTIRALDNGTAPAPGSTR